MLLQILPRYDLLFQADSMTMLLKTLSSTGKKTWREKLFRDLDYSFIIDCDDNGKQGRIAFYLEVRDKDQDRITTSLKTMFSEKADVFPVEQPLKTLKTVNTLYTMEEKNQDAKDGQKKRLATYSDDKTFMYILGLLQKNTRIRIDFKILKEFKTDGRTFFRSVSSDVQAECLIRVYGKDAFVRNIVRGISESIVSLTSGEKKLRFDCRDSYKLSILSGGELMNLFQFPSLKNREEMLERIYYLEIGQTTLQPQEFSKGMRIGTLHHPVQKNREIRIDYTQLRKHMEISGMTGSGKSSFFEEGVDSILEDKVKGKKNVPGFTLFDPMESSALGVLDKIQKLASDGHDVSELLKITHYIDISDEDFVFPISLLYKGIEPTEILDFFKQLFSDGVTVQIDRMLSDGINALLCDDNEYAIRDVLKIFEDEEMRETLTMKLANDPYAEDSVKFLKSKLNPTQIDPIRNRINPFINTAHKKLMFGLTGKYDGLKEVRKWFDDGHIILFNLSGLKDFDVRVIVSYIVLRYYLEARKRPDNSLMHMIFADECQKTQLPKFNDIIAEGRKPGLMFCPMTQYIERYNDDFLKAILGNIDTKVSFRQGETGARKIVANTPNCPIDANALKRIPDRVGYVTTFDGGKIKTIMVEVKPPYRYNDGQLVPYGDSKEARKAQEINRTKNRAYAKDLMKRDWMTKRQAEKLVFKLENEREDWLKEEDHFLKEGDQMVWEE